MGECKSVSIGEIKQDNPRLCLSALRGLDRCFECPQYVSKSGIPCDSRIIHKKGEQKFQEKEQIKKQIKALQKKLKGMV